jgi:iron complex outermembrane receptor protein
VRAFARSLLSVCETVTMQSKFNTLLLSGAALLALKSPAYAQSAEDDPSWRQDTIVVTGVRNAYGADSAGVARTPTPLIDIPQSIQVLTPTLLKEQELQTLSDAVKNVSGVVPNDPAETVLQNPIVRGFEAEIFVDGLIAYGDTAVVDPSSLIGVERVEVAKGPTAVLFGGGTGAPVGGLINLVTKTPKPGAFVDVGVRAGSFGLVAPWVDANLPLGEKAGFRLAAEYSNGDSYIDAVTTERLTVHPSFAAALSDATDLVLRGQYSRIEQLEYSGIPTAVARLPEVDPFRFTGAPDAPETVVENRMITGELTHRFSSNLAGTLRGRYYDSSFDEFASFPFLSFFPLIGTQAPIIRGQLPTDIDEATVDASLLWEGRALGLQHTLLVGATYDAVNYFVGSGFDFTPIGVIDYAVGPQGLSFGSIPAITGEQANDYRTLAFYMQDEIKFGERLTLLLSGRYAEYDLEEVSVGNAVLTDEDYSQFDPRVGVSWRVNEGVSLFAGYATGSRLSLFFTGDQGQPPVPETSESIEAGVKFDVDRIGVSGTVAGFRITREDIPVLSFINPFASVQGGEQESAGVEIDLIWEPSENLSVLANLAYTDATITDDSNIPGADNVGNRLARVPETSGRFAARYRFTEGALRGLGLGLGLTYASEAPTTDENTSFGDDYVVLDAQASYDWRRYRLGLNVVNLTDKDYLVPYQYLAQDVVRPGQPLSAFVSLSARF